MKKEVLINTPNILPLIGLGIFVTVFLGICIYYLFIKTKDELQSDASKILKSE